MCRGRAYVWQPRYTGPTARRVAARDRMADGIPEGYFCMRYFFGTVPEMVRSIAIGAFVCLSAGVYLKNHTSRLHEFFRMCYLWPWLGPPLLCTSGFVNDVMFSCNGAGGHRTSTARGRTPWYITTLSRCLSADRFELRARGAKSDVLLNVVIQSDRRNHVADNRFKVNN